jgi:hypothetical protein
MTDEDLAALRAAVETLEHPGLAARLGNTTNRGGLDVRGII